MEAKDLRIGNWVDTPNGIKRVSDINIDGYCFFLQCFIKPIPLTEEWLLKFGFTDYEWCTNCAFIKFNQMSMMLRYYNDRWSCTKTRVTKDSKGHKMSSGKDIVKKGFIKHVHQLQNLYHALTGEELKIN